MSAMSMIAGLDIGNGYVKGIVGVDGSGRTESFDFMAGAAIEPNLSDICPKGDEIGDEVENIFDRMAASFDTPAVSSPSVRLFGARAVNSGRSLEQFDVQSTRSKVDQDLSGILILGSLAGAALRQYWHDNGTLPDGTLDLTVRCLTVALPITEYKIRRKQYADKFKGITHMVSIRNFDVPVRVSIMINDVQVLAEGSAAQFAIVAQGEPLMNAMLADLRSRGVRLDGVTAADILAARNTVGIDIGAGTVNIPVFQDGRFNPDVSLTFSKGYETILESAMDALMLKQQAYGSRKELASFLMGSDSALTRRRRERAQAAVDAEAEGFVQELGLELRRVLGRVGASTEVIYVYGGGATPLKDVLYPFLIDTVRQTCGGELDYPILYLDSAYSRFLNREGLFLVAEQMAGQS